MSIENRINRLELVTSRLTYRVVGTKEEADQLHAQDAAAVPAVLAPHRRRDQVIVVISDCARPDLE
jgi:hypothetical protein